MNSQLVTKEQADQLNGKVDLIKRNFAVGATDDELDIFMYQANRMGLDIIARQIHMVKRKAWDAATRSYIDKMSIQVGIDGYRIIADRTGNYAPGKATTFEYKDDRVYSATAYVMKYVRGAWVEVSATAHYSEYVQMAGKDDSRRPTQMWADKPHIMLSKCAEALALRRAFPAELSGVYTDEEMMQADNHAETVQAEWHEQPAQKVVSEPPTNGNGKAEPAKVEQSQPEPIKQTPAEYLSEYSGLAMNRVVSTLKFCDLDTTELEPYRLWWDTYKYARDLKFTPQEAGHYANLLNGKSANEEQAGIYREQILNPGEPASDYDIQEARAES